MDSSFIPPSKLKEGAGAEAEKAVVCMRVIGGGN